MSMIELQARGKTHRVPQVAGNLFVCAMENGGCCCGHVEKGRALVNKSLYESEWQKRGLRPRLHLTFVGCLGPCPVGNNAMLQISGRSIWLKDLNDDALIPAIFDYIEQVLNAGTVIAPQGMLAAHVYERYEEINAARESIDFTGLDPVCMMSVDERTAQWTSVVDGVTYGFCCSACKRAFDTDPQSYLNPQSKITAVAQPVAAAIPLQENTMNKTFTVPAISCDHCVRSIKNELSELAGVQSVQADAATKSVSVTWNEPATWEKIRAALIEIEYSPQELLQP
jgi:cobaltochelatase CobN